METHAPTRKTNQGFEDKTGPALGHAARGSAQSASLARAWGPVREVSLPSGSERRRRDILVDTVQGGPLSLGNPVRWLRAEFGVQERRFHLL
jgi:hypothetical protein